MLKSKVKKKGPAKKPILEKAHGKAKLPAPIMALAKDTPASQSEIWLWLLCCTSISRDEDDAGDCCSEVS